MKKENTSFSGGATLLWKLIKTSQPNPSSGQKFCQMKSIRSATRKKAQCKRSLISGVCIFHLRANRRCESLCGKHFFMEWRVWLEPQWLIRLTTHYSVSAYGYAVEKRLTQTLNAANVNGAHVPNEGQFCIAFFVYKSPKNFL